MSPDRAEVEAILSSILASEQNGLSLQRLDQEYYSNMGTRIPFEEYGKTSLAAFLSSMPHVVTIEGGFGKELIAKAAYNAATAHITKMVAEQKPGPIRVRRQQTQRPCHWKVHPYHKNPQRSRLQDVENCSWARGTMPFKNESRQGPLMPVHSNPFLLPVGTAQANSSQPRQPVAAHRHKVPVSSSASARRPLQDVTAVQQPVGSWQSRKATAGRVAQPGQRYPSAQNYAHGYGFDTTDMNAWTWFLKKAGVMHKRALVYAKLLMWQGVNPSSMWLFTSQDIFQMGIGDFRDIYLIQEHAHQLHAMHRSSAANENLLDNTGYHNPYHEAIMEGRQWLEDDHLHLTPPLRRCRNLRLKQGFSVTPLNLRSVVGRPSVKERLGWRN